MTNAELDQKANELRKEWLRFTRKPIENWEVLPERVRQAWRLLAGGEYFEKGMETNDQRKFFNRAARKRKVVPGAVVSVSQS